MAKSRKSSGMPKQNHGESAKPMSEPHDGMVPEAKHDAAVAFHGTMVHAAHHTGITRPSSHNAGSHDHKAREHADHAIKVGKR